MALTTIYIIDSTDGNTTFAIQPRTFDGIGGVQQNTDLTLYGNSTPTWGEKFNENFYHLLENFAVEQSDPNNLKPKHKNEAGFAGIGVNNPIEGQLWYNKTDKKMYVYSSSEWRSTGMASTSIPNSPISGDLWFDESTQLLKLFNGTVWIAAAFGNFIPISGNTTTPMTGSLVLNADPTASLHAATKQYVDAAISGGIVSVPLTGTGASPMTGFLELNADPTTPLQAATKQYVDANSLSGNFLNKDIDDTMNATNTIILGRSPTTGDPTLQAATKGYVDQEVIGITGFVETTGDTMTGFLTLNADPVSNLQAATKGYVDGAITPDSGRLLSIDKINYTSYYDINSSSFVTIPGFSVLVTVAAAPVTFTAMTHLHVHLSSNGALASYFELTVVGGEYVTPTTIAKVSPEGLTAGNIVVPSSMSGSGTLNQNTNYTFSIRGRNSTALPNQDVRLNTTDDFITSADPNVDSTIEVLTFS